MPILNLFGGRSGWIAPNVLNDVVDCIITVT